MSELAFNRALLISHNKTLTFLGIGSLILNMILAGLLMVKVSQRPMILTGNEGSLAVASAQEYKLEEKMLESFVRMITNEYLSFSPTSLPTQIDGIRNYLTARPIEAILESYNKLKSRISKGGVFHQFSIHDIAITKKKSPFIVEVQGVRTIYANGHYKGEDKVYMFEVKRIRATETNPYGLIVSQIVEKIVKDKSDGEKEEI